MAFFGKRRVHKNFKHLRGKQEEKEFNEILLTQDRERITEKVMRMGKIAREMLEHSLDLVENENESDAYAVIEQDALVDKLEMEINWECLSTMAMRQPVQDDLRYVFAVIKLTTDLERIGDESTNIVRHLLRYRPYWNSSEDLGEIPAMLSMVMNQLTQALEAMQNGDLLLARQIFVNDREIDNLYDNLYDDFLNNAANCESREFSRKAYILALARHLERVGDHVANIAEYVCFMITGERFTPEADPDKS